MFKHIKFLTSALMLISAITVASFNTVTEAAPVEVKMWGGFRDKVIIGGDVVVVARATPGVHVVIPALRVLPPPPPHHHMNPPRPRHDITPPPPPRRGIHDFIKPPKPPIHRGDKLRKPPVPRRDVVRKPIPSKPRPSVVHKPIPPRPRPNVVHKPVPRPIPKQRPNIKPAPR